MWFILILSDSFNIYHCPRLFFSRKRAKKKSLKERYWKNIKNLSFGQWEDFESFSKCLAFYRLLIDDRKQKIARIQVSRVKILFKEKKLKKKIKIKEVI